jgi:hypothetical protein
MSSKALTIVEEFIRNDNPQIRKNALIALAVINETDAITLIARTAMEDPETSVRQRAEDELVQLDNQSLEPAIQVAISELQSQTDEIRQRAYAFLGRLRGKGVEARPLFHVSWQRRLRMAARMNAYLNPVRTWRLRLRLWKACLLGLFIGSILARSLPLFPSTADYTTRIVQIVIASAVLVIIGLAVIIFAAQRAAPINSQPNRSAASVVEVTTTGALALLILLPIFLLVLVGQLIYEAPWLTSLLVVLIGLMVGLVRAGTIFAFGVSGNQRWNRFLQVAAGAAFGSVPFNLIVLLIAYYSQDKSSALIALTVAWSIHLPFAFGAANAFAGVDREAPPSGKSQERYPALRGLLVLLALILALGLNVSMVKLSLSRLKSNPPAPNTTLGNKGLRIEGKVSAEGYMRETADAI